VEKKAVFGSASGFSGDFGNNFYGKKLMSGYGDRVKGRKSRVEKEWEKKTKIESMKKMENQSNIGRETRQWK
jgi:hypothetical protein